MTGSPSSSERAAEARGCGQPRGSAEILLKAALRAAAGEGEGEGEGAEVERYFSDLGHEYVTLNAEYTT